MNDLTKHHKIIKCGNLYNEVDDIIKRYGKFVQLNSEATEELIRKLAKRRKLPQYAGVEVARTEV